MKSFKFRVTATVSKIEEVFLEDLGCTDGLSQDEIADMAREKAHEQFSILEEDSLHEKYNEESEEIQSAFENDLTVKVHGKFIEHDKINHIDLRSDLENDTTLEESTFVREGMINVSPETWSIDNGDSQYHYDSKVEYEQDCKILGI